MAWTTPKTWSAETLTSTDMNTHIRDNLNYLKDTIAPNAEQYARTSGNYTTTSTTFTDVDGTNMSFSLTTTGGDVMVTCAGYGSSGAGDAVTVGVFVTGLGTTTIVEAESTNNSDPVNVSFVYIFKDLAAGTYTFTLRYKGDGSTTTLYAGNLLFDAREILGNA